MIFLFLQRRLKIRIERIENYFNLLQLIFTLWQHIELMCQKFFISKKHKNVNHIYYFYLCEQLWLQICFILCQNVIALYLI